MRALIVDRIARPLLVPCFARSMEPLGPFEPHPRLAVAVSGGADSMALALLTRSWADTRGGTVLALTVDHTLRPSSGEEADLTLRRLREYGIAGRTLTIAGLARGPGLAERAREARYGVLLEACAAAGIPHLLLGHHRGDQVETVMMRVLSGSGARGLAGMPALRETRSVRLLRPLLDVPPMALRRFLAGQGMAWVEDPSNHDPASRRARLRAARADPDGTGEGTQAVAAAGRAAGQRRAAEDSRIAAILAERVTFRPEGHALLTPGPIEPEALAAVLRTLTGAAHAPPLDRVAPLARDPRPMTLWGARILEAGRLGERWLLCREARAMAPSVPARAGALWDHRFRLIDAPAEAAELGPLGADAARFRDHSRLPAVVLRCIPALRRGGTVFAVPHLGVGDKRWRVLFDPRNPASCAPFGIG